MTDRPSAENRLRQIRALLAKSIANGCTPEEQATSVAKAHELIAKWGFDPKDFTFPTAQIPGRTGTRTIARIQLEGVLANKDTKTILAEVMAEHPGARTTKQCVAWYRSHAIHSDRPAYVAARRGLRFDAGTRRWVPAEPETAQPEVVE